MILCILEARISVLGRELTARVRKVACFVVHEKINVFCDTWGGLN